MNTITGCSLTSRDHTGCLAAIFHASWIRRNFSQASPNTIAWCPPVFPRQVHRACPATGIFEYTHTSQRPYRDFPLFRRLGSISCPLEFHTWALLRFPTVSLGDTLRHKLKISNTTASETESDHVSEIFHAKQKFITSEFVNSYRVRQIFMNKTKKSFQEMIWKCLWELLV